MSEKRRSPHHRARKRAAAVKSLKFPDDVDNPNGGSSPPKENVPGGYATMASSHLPFVDDFFTYPPPPGGENSVHRRSMRIRKKTQFPFSQISPQSLPKSNNSDQLSWKKNHSPRPTTSDYGTASDRSSLYYIPEKKPSTKVANQEATSQSLGYSSDLDDVMSNLSIDEGRQEASIPEESQYSEDEWMDDEVDSSSSSGSGYLTLEDLKFSYITADLKVKDGVKFLYPLKGYSLPRPSKPGKSKSSRSKTNLVRSRLPRCSPYDLRNKREHDNGKLENIVRLELFDVDVQTCFLKAGLHIFQASPVISVTPHEVTFCTLFPASVQIPLALEISPGDEIHCLYSSSPPEVLKTNRENIQWKAEMAGKHSVHNGIVNFETFGCGLFVLVIRPKCPYTSGYKNIRARTGGKLFVKAVPHVEVSFPKNDSTEQDVLGANAKIYYDTEQPLAEFMSKTWLHSDRENWMGCLATPIIQLEPHGSTFEGLPVMITLPVPHYHDILELLGSSAKLSIWQSNTSSNEHSNWERLSVEYQINQVKTPDGFMTVITFPVTHFSFFKAVWETISDVLHQAKFGVLYFYAPFAMKCQANMQEYQDTVSNSSKGGRDEEDGEGERMLKGGSRFGLEVVMFQADKPWPAMSTYKYKVGQSNPKLIKAGTITIQLKSRYFGPDEEAGEDSEMIKEEPEFRGRDFEKQFICKFNPDFNINRGPFGKVLVLRHLSSRQQRQPIFEFNLQKQGNEANIEDPNPVQGDDEEWSRTALQELARNLGITDGDNWKQFAKEIGMNSQEMLDHKLQDDNDPFQTIVNYFKRRGGTPKELHDGLYKCHRYLKLNQFSGNGGGSNPSDGSSGRGSLSSNAQRQFGTDSDTSGTQTSQDSGLHVGRKRTLPNSRASGAGASHHSSRLSKRRRLFKEPGPSYRRSLSSIHSPASSERSSDSESPRRDTEHEIEHANRTDTTRLDVGNGNPTWQISEALAVATWKGIGRSLGMEETVLADVEAQHKNANWREQVYQMLLVWKSSQPQLFTFGNLYSALQRENLHDAARKLMEIKREHVELSTTQDSSDILDDD